MEWSKQIAELKSRYARLSPRRLQVARLFAGGQTYQQMALALGLTRSTAGNYLHDVYLILRVHCRDDLRSALSLLDEGHLSAERGARRVRGEDSRN